MPYKLTASAGISALMGVGAILAIVPAHAAPAPAPTEHIFMHGTSALAQFTTRSTCEAHARYEVNLVHNYENMILIPGVHVGNRVGSAIRLQCYPLRNGRWTYLTAYSSYFGSPIQPQDLPLDLSNRAAQVKAGTSQDTQTVWSFAHITQHAVSTTSQAACDAQRDDIVNLTDKPSSKNRLVRADYRCTTHDGVLGYEADYLSPSTVGLPNDHVVPTAKAGQPMMDILGYDFPGSLATNHVGLLAR